MMRKYYLYILVFQTFSLFSFAQEQLQPDWVITKASSLDNGNAEAWAIGVNPQNQVYWGVNMDMPGFLTFMDALVFRLDEEGNEVWIDTVAAGGFAQQSYHLIASDSLVYVGGRSCRSLGIDDCDALFLNTDAQSGSTGWEFIWDGGFGYEEIDGIALDEEGIFLSGWTTGEASARDLLLMKLDYAGNLIWQSSWSSPGQKDDHQDGHMVVDEEAIYVSGLYDGSVNLGWDGRSLLAKFDKSDGTLIDSVLYGRQDAWVNAENALGMTTDGTYLYATGYTTISPNNWEIFVAKFDKELNMIWHRTWGDPSHTEVARAISVAADGSIYIGGNTESLGSGGSDIVLLKFDPEGTLQWYKLWGGTEDEMVHDVFIHNNHIYLTGKTHSFHPQQKSEALLLKTAIDSLTSTPIVIEKEEQRLHLFPNPTGQFSNLSFSNPDHKAHQAIVYDIWGRVVFRQSGIHSNQIPLTMTDWPSGLYLVELWNDKGRIGKEKLILN